MYRETYVQVKLSFMLNTTDKNCHKD